MSEQGYPRPQLRRADWISLDGLWDFALDPDTRWRIPAHVSWQSQIRVPFAPETTASGIGEGGFYRACWYRRTFEAPPLTDGDRVFLRFGAVDYSATVWVNGLPVARHEGGYTPFSVDVTRFLLPQPEQEVVVRAQDEPTDLTKPRGKQDWKPESHSIWYPRTSGIWQTVWVERVPRSWLRRLRWTPNLERWEIDFEAELGGLRRAGFWLSLKLMAGDRVIADDSYRVLGGEVHRRIALSDPGVDDFRNELLWSPSSPMLLDAQLDLWAGRGELVDSVRSYTALRSVATQGDRFLLNGRPYPLRMVLDQGYWPGTGATPPSDEALRYDVELAKRMGFNGVRKHQKIEVPRYLYWADRLGLLVWEEMPSAYRFTRRSVERVTREWQAAVERDYSHPSVVAWVPFNESWGVPNLPNSASERHYVQALYHLTKTLDSSRPVVGNDGWESVATDIIGIHDYDQDPLRLAQRYRTEEQLPKLLRRARPGGRLLVLEGETDRPVMLTEFGGLALPIEDRRAWGYLRTNSVEEFGVRYGRLLEAVRSVDLFSGFCYTQFADTYQEQNGLLFADRTPKIPLEQIAEATTGMPAERAQQQVEEPTDMLPPGGEGSRHGQAAAAAETAVPSPRRGGRRHGS